MAEQDEVFKPPYRYEVSVHGPATIYDAVDVGWIARVKESLPHKEALAAAMVDGLNRAAAVPGPDETTRKLLEDVAAHLHKHTVWIDEDDIDYPGYPSAQEAEARDLYRRITEQLG